jgi:hypothetical protein
LQHVHIPGTVWEPCAGAGHISKVLALAGYPVVSTDIVNRDFDQALVGYEYDATKCPLQTPFIVTNPPFNLAEKMLRHWRDQGAAFIALLLKSSWLQAGVKRGWIMKEFAPTDIYALSWRPDFTGKGAPTGEMSWYVWDKGSENFNGSTRYHVIDRVQPYLN